MDLKKYIYFNYIGLSHCTFFFYAVLSVTFWIVWLLANSCVYPHKEHFICVTLQNATRYIFNLHHLSNSNSSNMIGQSDLNDPSSSHAARSLQPESNPQVVLSVEG